ncbi:MAG: polyprenyl synthetase family protein [Chloroflexota bacterium]
MANWYIETFSDELVAIDTAIRTFIQSHDKKAEIFWQQIYEHFDYIYPDALQEPKPFNAGKRVRPLMMMLVARSLAGRYEQILPAGVALELIHNFTLIHDDIMDGDDTRRGRPTLWTRYGVAQAIDSGDGLFALGIISSLQAGLPDVSAERVLAASRYLIQACLDTVEGQALDISFEDRLDITPDEYLTMIRLKTGRFIETATHIGALLSTDDAAVVANYTEFGKYLGLAFQMQDDYLGIWGDPEVIGKSSTGDIENKKKSYPITYAFTHADEPQQKRLHAIYTKDELDTDDVSVVLGVLDELDVRAKTEAIVEQYYTNAMSALDALGLDNADYDNLRKLAQFIVQRSY